MKTYIGYQKVSTISRHNGGPMKDPPQHHSNVMVRGVSGGIPQLDIMPRGASLIAAVFPLVLARKYALNCIKNFFYFVSTRSIFLKIKIVWSICKQQQQRPRLQPPERLKLTQGGPRNFSLETPWASKLQSIRGLRGMGALGGLRGACNLTQEAQAFWTRLITRL